MNYLCEIPEIQGMASKGVMAGEKHLSGNDQENNREGISVFFNEQAFREGSLRGAEGALTKGGGMAVMQAFNRLGMVWCSASEALCTQVVRNEWGFEGFEETDAVAGDASFKTHWASTMAVGTNIYCLDFSGSSSVYLANLISETDDGYLLGKLRDTAHRYLYVVANSSVMNGYSVDSVVESVTPWWQPTMYALIAVFGLLTILCVVMVVLSGRKKDEIKVEEVQI
jgi:beta-glucosidase